MLIAVSRFGHCLFDLLHRWRAGLLPVEIVGVVSNHEDMRSFTEWSGLPYIHLPTTKTNKAEQEEAFLRLVDDLHVDLVVLARYMQILSPALCARLSGRCINIHHSFLPSFKGAKPYHQAHERGVKIIGATAHYVTTDLDEGPIIEQGVHRVDHSHTPTTWSPWARDVECTSAGARRDLACGASRADRGREDGGVPTRGHPLPEGEGGGARRAAVEGEGCHPHRLPHERPAGTPAELCNPSPSQAPRWASLSPWERATNP